MRATRRTTGATASLLRRDADLCHDRPDHGSRRLPEVARPLQGRNRVPEPEGAARYHAQLIDLPLASYHYKRAKCAGPQLGFIIEDIEPSVAVSGDHVNMYGYLSMAVAAIQVQQEQIAELQRELERMRDQLEVEAAVCGP